MNTQRGFTIIELMTVIAVLGVALGIGVPVMSSFLQDNRLTSNLNSLSSVLMLARSEAVKRNGHVAICASNDGQTCNAGSTWETGWLAFYDRNNDQTPDFAGGDGCDDSNTTQDCLLVAQAALPGSANVGQSSGQNISIRSGTPIGNIISFNSSGVPSCGGVACTGATSLFTFCDNRGPVHARSLSISQTGRAAVMSTAVVVDTSVCHPP